MLLFAMSQVLFLLEDVISTTFANILTAVFEYLMIEILMK